MNKNTLCKKIHQTMREHGYQRSTAMWHHGKKTYKTIVLPTSVIVKIPGEWSIPLSQELKIELINILDDFNPSLCSGFTGVEIYF